MIKLSSVWEQLNRRNKQRERVSDFEYDESFKDTAEEKEFLTQFIQMQKNQLIQLKEHLKRYCHTLPVFGLNSAKCDINLIKSYLLPILVNERQIEPTAIKKANQIVFFKCGDVQLLDIVKFLGGATSLEPFLKAYKTEQTNGFSPFSGLAIPKS